MHEKIICERPGQNWPEKKQDGNCHHKKTVQTRKVWGLTVHLPASFLYCLPGPCTQHRRHSCGVWNFSSTSTGTKLQTQRGRRPETGGEEEGGEEEVGEGRGRGSGEGREVRCSTIGSPFAQGSAHERANICLHIPDCRIRIATGTLMPSLVLPLLSRSQGKKKSRWFRTLRATTVSFASKKPMGAKNVWPFWMLFSAIGYSSVRSSLATKALAGA